MGADPKRSALNGFCQMHEVKNVFVVDGSAFTTASEKNPTLTILALAWRATDYMADEIRAGRFESGALLSNSLDQVRQLLTEIVRGGLADQHRQVSKAIPRYREAKRFPGIPAQVREAADLSQ